MKNLVMVFLKYPEPGFVKTRLAARVGSEEAAAIYRRLVRIVLGRLPGNVAVWLMFAPRDREPEVRAWLQPYVEEVESKKVVVFRPQGDGDLGSRMEEAFDDAFHAKFAKVVVIGTDCVDIDGALFEMVWNHLDAVDVVFGPATDGGYYLLGLNACAPVLFRGIPWSASDTLACSLEAAEQAGISCELLPERMDVDSEEDWLRVAARLS